MRVARYGAGRTNQKLYFAKMAIQQLQESTEVAVSQAAYESGVFHVHGAYLAFLQELSRFYKLSPQLGTAEAIRQGLERKGQVSPEVVQIQALEENGQWLAQLQQAFNDCQLAPEPVEVQPEAELSDAMILRVAAPVSEAPSDIERLQHWFSQLHGLINDFRREMVEF